VLLLLAYCLPGQWAIATIAPYPKVEIEIIMGYCATLGAHHWSLRTQTGLPSVPQTCKNPPRVILDPSTHLLAVFALSPVYPYMALMAMTIYLSTKIRDGSRMGPDLESPLVGIYR